MGKAERVSRGPVGPLGAIGALLILALLPSSASASCPNEALRSGPSAALPDCRAYEQVSPQEKGGYDAVSRSTRTQFPADAAPIGAAITYMGTGPFSGAEGSLLLDGRISRRGESGWTTTDLTPPTLQPTAPGVQALGYDFSEDLSQVVLRVPRQELTAGMAPGTGQLYNLFLRGADGKYSLLNPLAPTTFPQPGCEVCNKFRDLISFAGASSDLSHVLFETNDILEGTGATASFPFGNLYENVGGSVHLVGVLPDGTVPARGAVPGAGSQALSGVLYSSLAANSWRRQTHAISEDGSRVVFQAKADEGQPDPSQNGLTEVYDRIDGETTVEVSAPAPGATPANTEPREAQFWAASADGSQVFFTSSAELTTNSNTGAAANSNDLYRYSVESGQTTDLTVDHSLADVETGAGVLGVVGSSNDGATVYFVATGELLSGKGIDRRPNLYVWHEDAEHHTSELRFIATLASGDARDWAAEASELQAYVTPDGEHLAFMSLESLTGYDNTDQNTPAPDEEVYEYSASSGALICVSCRSGSLPTGNAFLGAAPEHLAATPFHQPRVVSENGSRVFFSSFSELAPGATGPRAKVYEYENDGTGSCNEAGGCVSLISSGSNTTDDTFLDASGDGNDVFISTVRQLAATDTDGLVDVYGARVGGGFAEPVVPAECTSGCQTPGGAPAPPGIASGISGPSGNLAPVPATAKPPQAPTRTQLLARALRTCKKVRAKRSRASCEKKARARYATKLRAKKTDKRHNP